MPQLQKVEKGSEPFAAPLKIPFICVSARKWPKASGDVRTNAVR